MLFLKANEIIFAGDNASLVKNEHDEIKNFIHYQYRKHIFLALCASRTGNVMILNEIHSLYTMYTNWISRFFSDVRIIKYSIDIISQYGVEVKTIIFKENL